MSHSLKVPTVLVLGSTGQIGQLIVKKLKDRTDVKVRVTSRRRAEYEQLKSKGIDIAYLDLDRAETFAAALAGVDRVFLITGYSVAMLTQSKVLIDSAKKAGVQHIVHLGIFGEWDCTDPHFAWHQLIESYMKTSGMKWTNLHPNMFMENVLAFFAPKNGKFTTYWGDQRMGWVAGQDIATVAAQVLLEGPEKHSSKDYWMSTEVLDASGIAAILTEVLGQDIKGEVKSHQDFKAVFIGGSVAVEDWYAEGAIEFTRQVSNGEMGYIGTIRNDVPFITGEAALTFRQWAMIHKKELAQAAK
ncbi:NmrA family NAD(P)-binding protein [Dyadobacter subterraneus]|uniref:NmrA family NAD(P)-binding protein n=1 Tax=Dyadobacter subterraneus TaxID=2773304 RepID=A0ABR9W904_9BACT|nr:NmrA family NAD(P)-binding protein [Dyadobacter subterraneus]MBE9461930.1 NmrA family NAD(P)-binding protein [Dyadobacter subterraneus]